MILVFTIGCWLVHFLKEPYAILVFSLLFSWYFYVRFHKVRFIYLFLLLSIWNIWCLPSFQWAEKGEYTVYEIKTKYVLARNDQNQTILLYGIDHPQYYDVYAVDRIQRISGQNNAGVFNFAQYMAQKNIYCSSVSSDAKLLRRVPCLKNKIYTFLKKQNNPYIMKVFYAHSVPDQDWINRLGLPILGFLSWLQKGLKKRLDVFSSQLVTFGFGLFFMTYFSMSTGLMRFLCMLLARMICHKYEHYFALSLFMFRCLMPYALDDFAFVFPTLLSLSYHVIQKANVRFVVNQFILFSCLLYYFHVVDFTMLLIFPIVRQLYAFGFVLVFVPGIEFLFTLFDSLPHLEWHYMPGILYSIALVCAFYAILETKYKKSIHWMLVCGFLFFMQPYLNPCFSVYMIDIGQGDCTLIVEPFNKSAIMIDAGQNLHHDNMELFVEPFLKQKHISSLDALIVTHDDFDHSGGVESLSKRVKIKKLIRSSNDSIPVSYPMVSLLPERITTDENSKSIVSYFSYDGIDYVWTGDAGVEIEAQMLEKYDFHDVDILKLGHHGSKTSSSFEFLDACRPKLALVSAGYKNNYGHPDSGVMARCHELGIHVLETCQVGMISIHSWHHLAFFTTANGLFGILFLE